MTALLDEEAAALRALADWHALQAPPGPAHTAIADALEGLATALADPATAQAQRGPLGELAGLLHWLGESGAIGDYDMLADRYRRALSADAMPAPDAYLAALALRARSAAGS